MFLFDLKSSGRWLNMDRCTEDPQIFLRILAANEKEQTWIVGIWVNPRVNTMKIDPINPSCCITPFCESYFIQFTIWQLLWILRQGYDIGDDPVAHNLLTEIGFIKCLELVLRLAPFALLFAALPCHSFTWISVATHRRILVWVCPWKKFGSRFSWI